jgi:hypothetical protein
MHDIRLITGALRVTGSACARMASQASASLRLHREPPHPDTDIAAVVEEVMAAAAP